MNTCTQLFDLMVSIGENGLLCYKQPPESIVRAFEPKNNMHFLYLLTFLVLLSPERRGHLGIRVGRSLSIIIRLKFVMAVMSTTTVYFVISKKYEARQEKYS